ncbi:hypothetical protein R6Q59_018204, partial [Mikania micrantha]
MSCGFFRLNLRSIRLRRVHDFVKREIEKLHVVFTGIIPDYVTKMVIPSLFACIIELLPTAKSSNVYPKDAKAPPCGVDDMTKLAYLHEPGVLRAKVMNTCKSHEHLQKLGCVMYLLFAYIREQLSFKLWTIFVSIFLIAQTLEENTRHLINMAVILGRDDEIRLCNQILSRRTKNNPIIIGESGVGKMKMLNDLLKELCVEMFLNLSRTV